MSETDPTREVASAAEREPTEEDWRAFGDAWVKAFGRNPNSLAAFGGQIFRLGDFAIMSPASRAPFNEYGELEADPRTDTESPEFDQAAYDRFVALEQRIEAAFAVYAGEAAPLAPPASGP